MDFSPEARLTMQDGESNPLPLRERDAKPWQLAA
jgi:hypothetical protein